jgi:hypothetical protein
MTRRSFYQRKRFKKTSQTHGAFTRESVLKVMTRGSFYQRKRFIYRNRGMEGKKCNCVSLKLLFVVFYRRCEFWLLSLIKMSNYHGRGTKLKHIW